MQLEGPRMALAIKLEPTVKKLETVVYPEKPKTMADCL